VDLLPVLLDLILLNILLWLVVAEVAEVPQTVGAVPVVEQAVF
jgi:hypothetical protein